MTPDTLSQLQFHIQKAANSFPWAKIGAYAAEEISWDCIKKFYPSANYKKDSTRFPDIRDENSQISFEIKTTKTGKGILGNSVTQEDPKVGTIYSIWFLIDKKEVQIHLYEDLIDSIKVDHNPRFFLKLPESGQKANQLFQKLGCTFTDFLSLSVEDKNKKVKAYLNTNNSIETWRWFMGEDKYSETNDTLYKLMQIAQNNWATVDRDEVRLHLFQHHLDLLTKSRIDWHEFDPIVFKVFEAVGPIKDLFTAGGKDKTTKLPALFKNLLNDYPKLQNKLTIKELADWQLKIQKMIESKTKPRSQNKISKKQATDLYKKLCSG